MRSRRLILVVAAVLTALTVDACAAGLGVAAHDSPRGAPTNRSRTEAETDRLIALMPLPADRTRLNHAPTALSGPGMGTPVTSSVVDTVRLWRVAIPFAKAVAWVAAHPPPGLTRQGTSSADSQGSVTSTGISYGDRGSPYWTGAQLDVTMAPDGAGASVWRIDGQAEWLNPVAAADDAAGPRLHVTPTGGCILPPAGAVGVTSTAAGLSRALVPTQPPIGALLCRYQLGRPTRVSARRRVSAAAAQGLARVARRISLSHLDDVTTNCPSGRNIAVVVAFAYRGGQTVDLWAAGACPSVANGVVVAGGAGGGDVSGFDAAVDRLLR